MRRSSLTVPALPVLAVVLSLVLTHGAGEAGEDGSIVGRVTDAGTGDPLAGANVVLVGTREGAAAGSDGEYTITEIAAGTYLVRATVIGYEPGETEVTVEPDGSHRLDFALVEAAIPLPEIVVRAERLADPTSVSAQALSGEELRGIHGLLEDPIRSLHTLPGISTGEEFAAWLCVRGGSPYENLYLLDLAPMHWPWHFGGMKSLFNSDMVEKIELLTGGFPAKYGDKLSSVVNITTREGSRDRLRGRATVSLINGTALAEGPLTSSGSWICSARRSYYDLVLRGEDYAIPSFYDIQAKTTYELSPEQKLSVSGLYSGEDVEVEFEDPEPGEPRSLSDHYRVSTLSAQWKYLVTPRLYSLLSFVAQDIDVKIGLDRWWIDGEALDYGVREDLTYGLGAAHEVEAGVEYRPVRIDWTSFLPVDPREEAWTDSLSQALRREIKGNTWIGGAYVQDSWEVGPRAAVTAGLRYDYLRYTKRGDLSPRLAVRYDLGPCTALRSAWGRYRQTPELTEITENRELESKLATHAILGVEHRFGDDWRGWVEVYEKDYSSLIAVDSLGHHSNGGSGFARGIECFLQKKRGTLSGWLSYSLSLAKRKEYLDTEEHYFDYDQRHLFTILGEKDLGRGWRLAGTWRYATGRPYTRVVGALRDPTTGVWIPIDGERNSARYPAYHRLDLKMSKTFSFRAFDLDLYLEVLNAYNRKNLMGYAYTYTEGGEPVADPYYGLPILPAMGITLDF